MKRLACHLLLILALLPVVAASCDSDGGASTLVDSDLAIIDLQAGDDSGKILGYLAHIYGHQINGSTISLLSSATIENTGANAEDVIVEVQIPGYTEKGRASLLVPAHASASVTNITPAFKFDQVYGVTTSAAANLEVTVVRGDATLALHSQPVTIEPVNRVLWYMKSGEDLLDVRVLALTLITPDAPAVHTLLTEAAGYSRYGAMFGYQNLSDETVWDQVNAVWAAVQARGVVYTSIPGSFFDGAQYVKLPKDSLQTGSANCVDGTFLFASAFEALGMEPVIVFLTSHVLMGVRMAPGSNRIIYLETTMVSSATLDDANTSGYNTVSGATSDPQGIIFDLKKARGLGITPVNIR